LVRRGDYWQMGEDGQPLTYLDEIEIIDLGTDPAPYIAAIQNGQIDGRTLSSADDFLALKDNPQVVVGPARTAQTRVLRFRVDTDPWQDNRLVRAVTLCQDRQKIIDQAFFSQAEIGNDAHVAPIQPDYSPMDTIAYDPDKAKALLQEAGVDSLDFKIAVGSGWPEVVSNAETLQADAKPAGINITLDSMPVDSYWNLWTEAAVGITPWTHRPLGVMLLPLAYIADSEGKPVPWNESRWVDEEFSTLLKKAQSIADNVARREVMKDLQRIQSERGSVGIPMYLNQWEAHNPGFQGVKSHPTGYWLLNEAWYDPDKDPFKA
jgi:peptide/nickel transport system substrate-binding protein